ncbi:MAG TPA: hypothetical protein VMZ71_14595, partial [Gemmataceae bacterium]|nr:hypothetical protein [Gemmataceae bacterium]
RSDPKLGEPERRGVEAVLRGLRWRLDPDWVAVFDRPKIENCRPVFAFECPKKWENLTATANTDVRFCESCRKTVHYCQDVRDARTHARRGACVAVAVGEPRSPDDLRELDAFLTMGIMLPEREWPAEEDVTERKPDE